MNDDFPSVITQIMLVYRHLFDTLEPIMIAIIISIISNDLNKTKKTLSNLRYILHQQEPHLWPDELLSKLSYISTKKKTGK